MSSTQDCLLDAAEALFVEKGYAATSLRSIATRANANLAATHYHFGSKQGLFAAVVHRRVTPINLARMAALDALEANTARLDIRSVLEAFLLPLIKSDEAEFLQGLIGRIYSEPQALIRPMLEQEFGIVARRFVAVLSSLLPDLSITEVRWRFHFLIGSMLQTLSLPMPLGAEIADDRPQEKFQRLINFAISGFLAPEPSLGEPL
ncbi:MAG: AcrR family transcriptional regulator [Candidatus Azotimanducaceae bacterium]|jgi:AcrR family transcriptional regulator